MTSSALSNKDIAIDFLNLIVAGAIDTAYEKYVVTNCIHHNVFFLAGINNLRQAMQANHAEHPDKKLVIQHVIADHDLVAVHSHLMFNDQEPGMIVIHLFRFAQGKIVELWDCGQKIPIDQPNTDGAF